MFLTEASTPPRDDSAALVERVAARLRCSLAWLVGGALVAIVSQAALADWVRYELVYGSELLRSCQTCTSRHIRREGVAGYLEVTPLPPAFGAAGVFAVTAAEVRTPTLLLAGHGFWQMTDLGRHAMVLQLEGHGQSWRFTSGRRQPIETRGEGLPPEFAIILSARAPGGTVWLLQLKARRESGALVMDADGDGVADRSDNCPRLANLAQQDQDADGVGDACDVCADTPTGALRTDAGCSVEQLCPCDGRDGRNWTSRRAYGICVASALRLLRNQGRLSEAEARAVLKKALRSGCGATTVARYPQRRPPAYPWVERTADSVASLR